MHMSKYKYQVHILLFFRKRKTHEKAEWYFSYSSIQIWSKLSKIKTVSYNSNVLSPQKQSQDKYHYYSGQKLKELETFLLWEELETFLLCWTYFVMSKQISTQIILLNFEQLVIAVRQVQRRFFLWNEVVHFCLFLLVCVCVLVC
jgi:hypothetical protein